MSRGFKIFLFLLLGVVTFAVYQARESRLARIIDGFHDHVVGTEPEDALPPWRRALREYGEVNPIDGALVVDETRNELMVVKIRPDLTLETRDPEELALELAALEAAEALAALEAMPTGDVDGSPDPGASGTQLPGELLLPPPETLDDDSREDLADGEPVEEEPAPAEEAPPAIESDENEYTVLEHLVTEDERLWNIAARYLEKGWRYKEIMAWNDLESPSIRAGQKLVIRLPRQPRAGSGSDPTPAADDERPLKEVHVHRVSDGESLATIARRYYRGNGDRWEIIHQANRDQLKNPDQLVIGMKLKIPGPLGGID